MDTLRRLAGGGLGLLLAIGLAIPLQGCNKKEGTEGPGKAEGPGSDNDVAPHWVAQASPRRKVAVVFVHGIFGGTDATWTHANGKTFFDYLGAAPGVGDKVDIFAFGFTSRMLEDGSLDIYEAANTLDEWLVNQGVWEYPNVVFVGHSMGGLVAMRELLNHRQRMDQVPLLMLYATPQEGAQVTRIADVVANNPAIKQMLPGDDSQFLKEFDDTWRRIPAQDRPTVICAYETMPTFKVEIVTRLSATRYCDDAPMAIGGTDHLSIVKPHGADHGSVIKLVNSLEKYVVGSEGQPLLGTPDFAREGDKLVYEMRDVLSEETAELENRGARKLRFEVGRTSNPKLWVQPSEGPQDIPAGASVDLKFNLLLRGRPEPEYRFTLTTPVGGMQTVVVRVADPAAARAQEVALMEAVGEGVQAYLSAPENADRLQTLSDENLQAEVAGVAHQALLKQAPNVSPAVGWVLAADALANAGWADLAGAALRRAEAESPATVTAPSVQMLASVIASQSGQSRVLRAAPPAAALPADELKEFSRGAEFINPGNARTWTELSTRMQQVPALEQQGKMLEGDVLQEQGQTEAAKAVYLDAERIKSNPVIRARIRTASAVGGG